MRIGDQEFVARPDAQLRRGVIGILRAVDPFERGIAAAKREFTEGGVFAVAQAVAQSEGAFQTDLGLLPIEIVEPWIGARTIGMETRKTARACRAGVDDLVELRLVEIKPRSLVSPLRDAAHRKRAPEKAASLGSG